MKLRKLKMGSRGLRRQAVKSHLKCGLWSEHLTIVSLFHYRHLPIWTHHEQSQHAGIPTITRLLDFVTGHFNSVSSFFPWWSLCFFELPEPMSPELEFLRLYKGSFLFFIFTVSEFILIDSPCSHRSIAHTQDESWPVRKGLARWISR